MDNKNFNNLSSVSRNGSEFTARYEWTETVEVKHALPVGTGNLTPKGTIAISRTLKKVVSSHKQVAKFEDVKISAEEAQAIVEGAISVRTITSRSKLADDRWVVNF